MSQSSDRISSYRRHFDGNSSLSLAVRVSSPSPTRMSTRHRSAGYGIEASTMRAAAAGRRTISSTRKLAIPAVGAGALCVGGEAQLDLDKAAAENQEFLTVRSSERQEMIVLNDRLASYIERVRSLEQENMQLDAEIEAYRNRYVKPSGLRMLYENQLKELMRLVDQLRGQRDLAVAAKEAMAAQLEAIKAKYEEAILQRKQAEMDLEAFRPDVDKATSVRIALEKQLEQLQLDLEFLQRVQKQEIEELMKQIYSTIATAQSSFAVPDLSSALMHIQKQYDDIASKNLQEMDAWYSSKFEDLNNRTSRSIDKVRSVREEINNAKKEIQNKENDLEDLKTKNDALEAKLLETLERHKKEIAELQAKIEALQNEMKITKEKSAKLLREYQELLNVKMALEIEITTYRKLIEGEDSRLAGMVKSLSLAVGSSASAGTSGGSAGGVADGMAGSLGGGNGGSGQNGNGHEKRSSVGSVGSGNGDKGGNGYNRNGTGANGALASDASGDGVGVDSSADNENGASPTGQNGEKGGDDGAGTDGSAGSITSGNGHGGNATIDYCTMEQEVEVTERKTVLIRTVKMEGDVLQSDILEQTITVNGAAGEAE